MPTSEESSTRWHLPKKITADSVRHLSQHTQFITENAAGEIQPTRILNVTTEESYDLYENRFVYHLIQRLFAFVDKRTGCNLLVNRRRNLQRHEHGE